MTTLARNAEADRASVAFQIALAQIGVETIEEALALWNAVDPTSVERVRSAWLRRALNIVMGRRRQSRDLAIAYYRLARALRTGATIQKPFAPPEPTHVPLGKLREEFESLVPDTLLDISRQTELVAPAPTALRVEEEVEDEDEAADRILVEEIEQLERDLAEQERLAAEEARIDLEALGPNLLEDKLREVDTEEPGTQVDAARAEAHRKAGTRQAAAAARLAKDGGRSAIWTATENDRRVVGYARLSRTGTPCGWCAMLISRGPVYKSESSATYSDGDLYHDNCNCYAEPLWSDQQYDESALFYLNRLYAEQWPMVTEGLSGKSALSAWRRFIRQTQRTQAVRPTSVQEA